MAAWFWYAVVAAVLYGAHQIFTRIAADHIGEGLGGFVVEATAALSILLYLGIFSFSWVVGIRNPARKEFSLFCSYRNLRRRWDNRLLSSFSKRGSAFFRSSDLGWRRGDHGYRRHLYFFTNRRRGSGWSVSRLQSPVCSCFDVSVLRTQVRVS